MFTLVIKLLSVIPLVIYVIYFYSKWYYSITIERPDESYDFIIVGGGASGSVLANRLSQEESWKVLLLEAGGSDQPDPRISVPILVGTTYQTGLDWGYMAHSTSLNQKNITREFYMPRGKVLGGCTAINSNFYVWGSKHDYNQWEKMGATKWGFDDIINHFMNLEDSSLINGSRNSRGGNGEVKLSYPHKTPLSWAHFQAAKELGISSGDYNGGDMLGIHLVQASVANGQRQSASVAFLRPIAHQRRNWLHIVSGAKAKEVLFQKSAKNPPQASGVVYVKDGKEINVHARKEVILSSGVFGTPQLLMLSGIGPKTHLEKVGVTPLLDLPGVGRNLHDHSTVMGCFATDRGLELGLIFDDLLTPSAVYNYVINGEGPLSGNGAVDAMAFLRTKLAQDLRPDLQMKMFSVRWDDDSASGDLLNLIFHQSPQLIDKKRKYLKRHNRTHACDFFNAIVVLHPHSRGRVKIRTQDHRDHPDIDINYIDDKKDVDVLVEGFRILERFAATEAYKKLGVKLLVFDDECDQLEYPRPKECYERYIRESVGGFHHPVGTARIGGADDEGGVVDPRLRVHGVEGLRVADASVMPAIPSGNTMAPCYMVGSKAAQMIKDDWEGK